MSVSIAGIVLPFVLAFALTPWFHTLPGLFADKTRPGEAPLFLGAAIAITAFPMLARSIHERGLAGTSLGTLALTAGAVDDAAAWCTLDIVLASFGGSWSGTYAAIGGGIGFALIMMTDRRVARGWKRAHRPRTRIGTEQVEFSILGLFDMLRIHRCRVLVIDDPGKPGVSPTLVRLRRWATATNIRIASNWSMYPLGFSEAMQGRTTQKRALGGGLLEPE